MNRLKTVAGTLLLAVAALAFAETQSPDVKVMEGAWKKGGLHAHTLWSDGRSMPEKAISTVKKAGFDFWSITEHNVFPDDPDAWREICKEEGPWPPRLTDQEYQSAQNLVPGFPKNRTVGTWCWQTRLMTFQEMCQAFNEPGKFVLIPGCEFTYGHRAANGDSLAVHCNWLNIPKPGLIEMQNDDSIVQMLDKMLAKYRAEAASSTQPTIFMLNHPFAPYFNVLSTDVIARPEIRFAEIVNSEVKYLPPKGMPGIERWWDAINSFRIADGKPGVYGIASDDAHFYDDARINTMHAGVGGGFVCVHLPEEMTPDHLIEAINRGDFYASSGAYFDSITMDYERGVLKVKVRPVSGAKCHIRFNGTKRGFDRTVTQRTIPYEGKPCLDRTVPVYSDEVGQILYETDGWTAEYQFAPDDLYVRATAITDVPSTHGDASQRFIYPATLSAWTQPMLNKK